jgi:hypothetical protein
VSKCYINFHVIIFSELFLFYGWFTRGHKNVSELVRMQVVITWFQASATTWRGAVFWMLRSVDRWFRTDVLGTIGVPKRRYAPCNIQERVSQVDLIRVCALFLCLCLCLKHRLHRTIKTMGLNSFRIALSFLFHLSCNILHHNRGEFLSTLCLRGKFFSFCSIKFLLLAS